jgi:FlaA1/EpsC-like NDP-sugar epimerase
LAVPEMGGSTSDLSCPTSSLTRRQPAHIALHEIERNRMKIMVIGGPGVIGSKLLAAIAQVSHA